MRIENQVTVDTVALDTIPEGSIRLRIDTRVNGEPHTEVIQLVFEKSDKAHPVHIVSGS
ncbi:MAG: hypothetical protein PHR35_17210 [Kiritimatiellae bacterium]|nr:hypothetical protein [Kiritimatiellia bacterium]